MPRAEKQDISGNSDTNHRSYSPYNQSGRKAKVTSRSSWSPSIWNVLMFWKSRNTSHEEDEDSEGDMSIDHDEASSNINHNNTTLSAGEEGDHEVSSFNISTLSEEQVLASLSRSTRHVHFQLPNGDQGRLNNHYSQSTSETPVRSGSQKPYVAPLPPSSPLRQSGSSKDPLAKVTEYIDTVLRPRGGECTDVEALGLSMLIQSSVNQSGKQHGIPSDFNPFLLPKMNSGFSSASSSPSSVRPMFTSPSTDIQAVLASSSGPSGSPSVTSPLNTSSLSRSSPSRTLSQNPNGTLYYQGGGSSRPRYRSSAFGSPARKNVSFSRHFGEGKSDTPNINGTAEMPSPSDGKRRRVGEEKDSSVAQASGSPAVMLNGITTPPRATVVSTPAPRFGSSSPASRFLASTPARPSPLRQSTRADSSSPGSSSPGSANAGSPHSNNSEGEGRSRASEKASEILAGIIKDATPKKDSVPDLRNPYQPTTRSPTKRSRRTPANLPRPPLPRPTRKSNGSPSTPQPKKLSALETIQRTAPQAQTGAKRSHTGMPPPTSPSTLVNGTINGAAASQPRSNVDNPIVIELDDDDDEPQGPPAKKQKSDRSQPSLEGTNKEVEPQVYINVDDEDVDMAAPTDNVTELVELNKGTEQQETQTQQQETKRSIFTGPFTKGVAATRFHRPPKEPSPLRQSFQPDTPPSPPENPPSVGKASSTLFGFTQTSTSSAPSPFVQTSPSSSPFAQAFTPSSFASASEKTSTPSPFASTSAPSTLTQPSPLALRSAPSSFASASLPFASTSGLVSFAQASASSAVTMTAPSPLGPTSSSPFGSNSTLSPFGFSPVPARDTAPVTDATPTPKTAAVTAPSISSPPDTSSASTETDTDWVALTKKQVLEVPVSSLPTFAFAFTTSVTPSELSDQRDAVLAIPITELPKFDFVNTPAVDIPAPAPVPKMEVKSFDWAAAGMKPLESTGWTCGTCLCQNTEGSSKCSVCDEAKPVPAPAPTGFNWAAAGITPPVKTGWACGTCLCQNAEGLSKCSVCGEDKP